MIIQNKELLIPFYNNNQIIPKNFSISDADYFCPTLDGERDLNEEISCKISKM